MICSHSRSVRSVACCGAYFGSSRQSPILFWRGQGGDDVTNFGPNTPIIGSVWPHYLNCGCNIRGIQELSAVRKYRRVGATKWVAQKYSQGNFYELVPSHHRSDRYYNA